MTDEHTPGLIQGQQVTMIGTGDGGMQPGTVTTAITPGGIPNLAVHVITPVLGIVIRSSHLFLVTFLGLVSAAMTPSGSHIMPAADFYTLCLNCVKLSVATVGIGVVKDLITIFGKLEGKYPLLSGSV